MSPDMRVVPEEVPAKLDSNLLSFDRSDWIFTGCMAATGMIVQGLTNSLGFLATIVLWTLLMLRRRRARIYLLPFRRIHKYWVMWARRGQVWPPRPLLRRSHGKAPANPSEETKSPERQSRRRPRANPKEAASPIPFEVNSIPSVVPGRDIGVLHNLVSSTDSIIFAAPGARIVCTSQEEQAQLYAKLAEVVKNAASLQRGYSVGVSMLFRKDPHDPYKMETELEDLLHPQALLPDAILVNQDERELTDEEDTWALIRDNWNELRDFAAEFTPELWMVFVVTIKRQGALARSKDRRVKTKDVKRLPANRISQSVLRSLAGAGVTYPRVLDKAETHAFVRGAWDVATIQDYYRQVRDPALRLSQDLHWPQTMRVKKGASISDGSFCGVLELRSQQPVAWLGYYRRLMAYIEAPYFSACLVGETVKAANEERLLEKVSAFGDHMGDLIGTTRKTLNAQDRERAREKRTLDVHTSVYSQDYSILIAVRTDTEDELTDQLDEITNLAQGEGIIVERIMDPVDQYAALWAANLGLNNLL